MRIQCALIAFTLHFSRNRTSMLRLRMSRDCHARTVVLVKNGSSTSSCCTVGVAVGFSTITYNAQSTESLQGKKVPCDNEEKAEKAKVNACRVCQMYL